MPDDDDERAAVQAHPSVAGINQFRSNTLALDLGVHRHGPEGATFDLADLKGAVHDVPDDSVFVDCHERQLSAAIGSYRVDDPALMILAEGAAIQIADRRDVFCLLGSDLDHFASLPAERFALTCEPRPTVLERADPHMITPTADGATTDDRPWHESSTARLDKCSAVLYGAPLSTIADTQVGSSPAHSKVMRGARATNVPLTCNVLAAALNPPS